MKDPNQGKVDQRAVQHAVLDTGIAVEELDKTSVKGRHITVKPPGATRRARLLSIAGRDFGLSLAVQGTTLVGRSPEADIVLADDGVSRRHARIVALQAGKFAIEDLGSRNGTLVNGQPVQKANLEFGDRLQLGSDCVLLFTHIDPAEEQLAHLRRMETVGRLTAGLAHDFNNFLAVIAASLEHLESLPIDERFPGQQADASVEDALLATREAVELTDRLLRLARPAGHDTRPVHIGGLLNDAAQLCHRLFDRGVALTVDADPSLVVSGNPAELQQALMNLCINARDAMPEGGRLHLKARRLTATEQAGPIPLIGDGCVLSVRDNGVGMTEAVRQRVFDPFFTTKGEGRGSGLGMASAFATVRRHGGHLVVESAPGRGTTVRVYLPFGQSIAAPETVDHTSQTGLDHKVPTRPLRILLIDDEALVLRSLIRQLGRLGHKVVGFEHPADAVAHIDAEARDVDVVLLDLHLGDCSGVDVMEEIRQRHPQLPVVVTSGCWEPASEQRARDAGAFDLVRKPCGATTLHETLVSAVCESPRLRGRS